MQLGTRPGWNLGLATILGGWWFDASRQGAGSGECAGYNVLAGTQGRHLPLLALHTSTPNLACMFLCTAPSLPPQADWLLKAHPLDSPASPSPEETIVSPPCPAPLEPAGGDAHGLHETHPAEALAPILEADSSADQPPDEVSGGPQLSPSASPQAGGVAAAGRRGRTTESANRAHDHGDAESVAASRAAPTIGHSARSQLSSGEQLCMGGRKTWLR
jgi:hypothetical protein